MHASQVACDEYDTIRLVNFIRSTIAAGSDPRPQLSTYAHAVQHGNSAQPPWADDMYLKPVLDNDTLLFYDYSTAAPGTHDAAEDSRCVVE